MAGPAISEQGKTPELTSGEVTGAAVEARVMEFFEGQNLAFDFDKRVGLGLMSNKKGNPQDEPWSVRSTYSVNGAELAEQIRIYMLTDGKMHSTVFRLRGKDEDESELMIEHRKKEDQQGLVYIQRVSKDFAGIDPEVDGPMVVIKTEYIFKPQERARIARRLGVKV